LGWIVDKWNSLSEPWQTTWTSIAIPSIAIPIIIAVVLWLVRRNKQKISPPLPQTPPLPAPKPTPEVKKAKLKIDISRLPVTDAKLYGRERELTMLRTAWAEGHSNIVTLIAMGGAGKTALLNTWLDQLGAGYGGAERVFGWSFYRQGASGEAQASADLFFDTALAWFGYTGDPLKSAYDKGLKLAEYVNKYKTLLVLDGVEPLQHPLGVMNGALKDQGLEALIKQLSANNPGMLLISSRVDIHEIQGKTKPAVIQHKLGKLTRKAGAQFLKSLGVTGTIAEMQKAVGEFGGHALALKLLGNWLVLQGEGQGGDIAQRDTIPPLLDLPDDGGHAVRVMQAYESQLAGTADLAGLFMVGLFDRPAPEGAIDVLMAKPVIAGLTDRLVDLKPGQWQSVLVHLRDLGLLNRNDDPGDTALDAHPLVREYFGARLKQQNSAAYTEAHSRLYAYYKNSDQPLPETLAEMEPLFAAIAHGCAAGKHQEVFDEVYYKRISRGGETDFIGKQLGGFGADLAALSYFFDTPWHTPFENLTGSWKAFALGAAGYRLRALGRLREAVAPMLAGLDMEKSRGDWINAARAAGNLSELHLTLGDVQQAVTFAQDSVKFADGSEDVDQIMLRRITHANALHQAGQGDAALALFQKVEAMQVAREKEQPYLYFVQGYQYCDLLLSMGQYDEVRERATQTLELAKNHNQLLDIALDTLSLGRVALAQVLNKKDEGFTSATTYLDVAINGLRAAGQQQYLPNGLLARAECYRHRGMFTQAETDLAEVFELSTRSGMRLFLTDAHLEAARLALALAAGKTVCGHDAAYHIQQAASLIKTTGYTLYPPPPGASGIAEGVGTGVILPAV